MVFLNAQQFNSSLSPVGQPSHESLHRASIVAAALNSPIVMIPRRRQGGSCEVRRAGLSGLVASARPRLPP